VVDAVPPRLAPHPRDAVFVDVVVVVTIIRMAGTCMYFCPTGTTIVIVSVDPCDFEVALFASNDAFVFVYEPRY